MTNKQSGYAFISTITSEMEQFRPSSAQESPEASSMPENQRAIMQDTMKDLMAEELRNAMFEVNLTSENAVFFADPFIVHATLERLREQHDLTSESFCHNIRFSGPGSGFRNESDSCTPFVDMLNKTIYAIKGSESTPPPNRYLSSLRFHTFGEEVKECIGSYKSLKPDVIGTLGPYPPPQGKVSWKDIEIAAEIKANDKDMIKQATTYARCTLITDRRRTFSVVITFNHKSLQVRFLVFHPSGLSSSKPLSFKTQEGFRGVVRHVVGLLSIQDEAGWGLDLTRSRDSDMFRINDQYYKVDRTLFVRDSLCGRSTVVYSLLGMSACGFPIHNLTCRTQRAQTYLPPSCNLGTYRLLGACPNE
jgi:hypothetical protein